MSHHARASHASNDAAWDLATVRRAIQILGAYRSQAGDVQSTARAVRFIWDFLQRRGVSADIFQLPGLMPLVVAGSGPVLVVSHIDSPGVGRGEGEPSPPDIRADIATGHGIVRKAGVLAAAGSLLCDPTANHPITLVIEADRHLGSPAIEAWMAATGPTLAAAAVEVVDLPVPAPAIYRGAAGVLVAQISIPHVLPLVPDVYRSVLPDAGHMLAELLAALKSRDAEVMLPGFYDDVELPDQGEMEALRSVSDAIAGMLQGATLAGETLLPPTHLTLGMFATPSMTVRDMRHSTSSTVDTPDAVATLELRLMPGQQVESFESALRAFVADRVPQATVDILLARPPAHGRGGTLPSIDLVTTSLPVAPGHTPAGLLESLGIPTVGFQTVTSEPDGAGERVHLQDILNGATLIGQLASQIAQPVSIPDEQ